MNFPKKLFRYRSADTNFFEDELVHSVKGEIFLSPCGDLNDPFDFRPNYEESSLRDMNKELKSAFGNRPVLSKARAEELSGQKIPAKIYKREAKKVLRPGPSMAKIELLSSRKLMDDLPNSTRLACFSEQEENIPMWAHYARNHSGICLGYEVLTDVINPKTELVPLKVEYCDERPSVSSIDLFRFSGRGLRRKSSIEANVAVMEKVYLQKSTHWSYEKEWRLFEHSEIKPDYKFIQCLKPIRITLGLKATKETREKVLNIVAGQLPIYEFRLSNSKFGFERKLS